MNIKMSVAMAIALTGCVSASPKNVALPPVENTAESVPTLSLRLSKAEIEAHLQRGELREISLDKLEMKYGPSNDSGLVTEREGIISIDGCDDLDITFLANRNDQIYVVTGTRFRHYPSTDYQRMVRPRCGELRFALQDGQTFGGQLLPPKSRR